MKLKRPFNKKDNTLHRPVIDGDSIVKRPGEKKDWFEPALIIGTGLMVGALCAYLLITYQVT
ncbi:MAG: hypothetical protein KAS66_08980 [Candidatus Omnitrophica bacterium]|nr:hypothetical protein [Candidatus Omnitrophota bacterium]